MLGKALDKIGLLDIVFGKVFNEFVEPVFRDGLCKFRYDFSGNQMVLSLFYSIKIVIKDGYNRAVLA